MAIKSRAIVLCVLANMGVTNEAHTLGGGAADALPARARSC